MHKVCILVLKNVPKPCLSCAQTVPNLCTSCAKILSHSKKCVQPIELHSERMFEKVTQRMNAILLCNTQQRQNVFVQHFVTLNSSIHHKTVPKERSLVKCFSTLEKKFCVSVQLCNILYLFLE